MVSPFFSALMDQSSNMMISSVFSDDNSIYTINKICMVTFFIMFLFRAAKTHFLSKMTHSKAPLPVLNAL